MNIVPRIFTSLTPEEESLWNDGETFRTENPNVTVQELLRIADAETRPQETEITKESKVLEATEPKDSEEPIQPEDPESTEHPHQDPKVIETLSDEE